MNLDNCYEQLYFETKIIPKINHRVINHINNYIYENLNFFISEYLYVLQTDNYLEYLENVFIQSVKINKLICLRNFYLFSCIKLIVKNYRLYRLKNIKCIIIKKINNDTFNVVSSFIY